MKYSQAVAIMALVSTASAVKIEQHTNSTGAPASATLISSDAFANAAVQARVDADSDIANEIKHHRTVDASAHNKAWKKHFKESEFYKQYAKHNEEESRCKENCAEKKKQLVQIQSEFKDLQQKYDDLKKRAPISALAAIEDQFKMQENEEKPREVNHLMVEEKGPAPFGIAYDFSGPGPAYPSPQPFLRGEKQWMDNS